MAEVLGVETRSLRRWQEDPLFLAEWELRAKKLQGSPERVQMVLDSLFKKAVDEQDVPAAKLYLQAVDAITPPTMRIDQTVTSKKSVAELSDDELRDLIAAEAEAELSVRAAEVLAGVK
jgi:hypothetical protein